MSVKIFFEFSPIYRVAENRVLFQIDTSSRKELSIHSKIDIFGSIFYRDRSRIGRDIYILGNRFSRESILPNRKDISKQKCKQYRHNNSSYVERIMHGVDAYELKAYLREASQPSSDQLLQVLE